MRAAVAIEWLKLRRSRVVRSATAVLVFLLPGSAAAFMAAYLSNGDSQFAAKVSTLLNGRTWADYLGLIGQFSSVGRCWPLELSSAGPSAVSSPTGPSAVSSPSR